MSLSKKSGLGGVTPHPPLKKYYASEAHRRGFVTSLFDRTAHHYDYVNGIMALGSGVRYRRDALRRAGLVSGMSVLDVAIGTGLVTRAARDILGDSGRVTGVDLSMGMLVQARRTLPVRLVQGVAESLPFEDNCTDFVTMGFALRHVADLDKTFREYLRVLKPGGTLLILEFTRPSEPSVAYGITHFYLNRIVPLVARLHRSGDDARALTEYFLDTVEFCMPPQTIIDTLAACGFTTPRRQRVLKIFSEYVANKP